MSSASTESGTRPSARNTAHVVIAALLLIVCLVFTQTFKTGIFRADEVGVPDFEKLIPQSFGAWRMSAASGGVVDPQLEAAVRKLYTSTLSRTYVHAPSGRQIMLSIGYGRDQSHVNQVHTPEQCYPGQGFVIDERLLDSVLSPVGLLPVVRLRTHLGLRVEPLTYWVLVGDRVVRGSFDVNLARIAFASRGQVADGLIFRVSEVRAGNADVFALQDRFVQDLLTSLPDASRAKVIGTPKTETDSPRS